MKRVINSNKDIAFFDKANMRIMDNLNTLARILYAVLRMISTTKYYLKHRPPYKEGVLDPLRMFEACSLFP